MSRRWAVRLERTEIESLKTLRLLDGAEICEQGSDIWVRGATLDESLAHVLRKHPHARRYWILPDDQLLGPDRLVPHGYLPAGPWSPLRDWLTVILPNAAFAMWPGSPTRAWETTKPTEDRPQCMAITRDDSVQLGAESQAIQHGGAARHSGRVQSYLQVRLMRAAAERECNVMITHVADWSAYGSRAPQIRLDRWYFAAAADGRVVVRGAPLPPFPGQQFVEDCGIGVPAGWMCDPEVSTGILRQVFDVEDQDLVLLCSDSTYERVRGDCFVRASRSAIRMTAREFDND